MQTLNPRFPEGVTRRTCLAGITQENTAGKLQTHSKYCKYSQEYETGFVLLKAPQSHISVFGSYYMVSLTGRQFSPGSSVGLGKAVLARTLHHAVAAGNPPKLSQLCAWDT